MCCQHPEQQCVYKHFKPLIKTVMLCGKWHDTDWTTPKSIYYIRNQQDAPLAVSFISHCKITLHVSDGFCVHHQEY